MEDQHTRGQEEDRGKLGRPAERFERFPTIAKLVDATNRFVAPVVDCVDADSAPPVMTEKCLVRRWSSRSGVSSGR